MKLYAIRSSESVPSALELLKEIENGFYVRIVHKHEGWEDIREEFMTRDLFNTCLRTGYIFELTA